MMRCGECDLVMAGNPNPLVLSLCRRCARKHSLRLRGQRTHSLVIIDDAAFLPDKSKLRFRSFKHGTSR